MSIQAFENAQAKARVPGSVVLNAWRENFGPETTGKINNVTDTRNNLTVQELVTMMSGGATTSAGQTVNETTAMKVSAVYACVALIAGAISTLPVSIYQRNKDGRQRVEDHPYWWILNEQPEEHISAAVFWEYMVSARLFHGDCFAEILRPSWRSSQVSGLMAHHPLRVWPFYAQGTTDLWYRITPINGPQYILAPSDILHIPSLGFNGLLSPSPITYAARQAVGTAIATADYNGRFFSNGARPDFALQTDGNLTPEQVEILRTTWHSRHGGSANAHMPAVLTGGLKAQPLTLSAADSQILQTASWNLEEICRVLGVPPFMVGSTEKSTSWGTGQENMGRGFVKYTLLRDLRKFEQEINRKFWPSRQTYFVEFDVSGLERGDLKSENEALRVALGRAGEPGWMSVNDVRRVKLLPPVEGGDEMNKAAPPVDPAKQAADQQAADQQKADAAAKNLMDMRTIANEAQKPTVVNVAAPVINLTVPEQAAPVVHNTVNVPETTVNFEAVMPEQAAPVVNNTVNVEKADAPIVNVEAPNVRVFNEVPAVQEMKITAMPDRKTESTVTRDADGNITKAVNTEKDA